jgi:cyclohexa-1,5-dienecarbonyl-CoA hydratase
VSGSRERAVGPLRITEPEPGLWHVRLAAPDGNVLDRDMIRALADVFTQARGARDLKAVCLAGEGPNFSYGASVAEHRAPLVAAMLDGFHTLFRIIADASVVTLAAVRGQCLGGGLELAAFCHRVFAAPNARLGQPEIKLGVFAPIASLILSERVGRSAAEDVCLSGRALTAQQAAHIRLVDEVCDDPLEAATAYARAHLLAHSAASLRFAVRAARLRFHARLIGELGELERLYLAELMATHDANEGIAAFLDKRRPVWRNA